VQEELQQDIVMQEAPLIEEEVEEVEHDVQFDANLAIDFPENGLKRLASDLLESVEEVTKARKEWIDNVEKAIKYLGLNLEDLENIPFKQATRTFDSTFLTCVIKAYATTRSELLPQNGPAGYLIESIESDALEEEATHYRDQLNYFLTVVDSAYYPDFEKFLLYTIVYGSGFKKVWYDKLLNRPKSRFIMPEDFVIDSDCSSILESNRLTHILRLSKREIILNQQNDSYLDVELPYLKSSYSSEIEEDEDYVSVTRLKDGTDLEMYTKRSLFPIYEVHTYINLEDYKNDVNMANAPEVPLPYIITIDKISMKVLSIRRNWDENDPEKKRNNFFVHYKYLPGFGVYGIGLAQMMGSNAISSTQMRRQLCDAASFKNFPGGLRTRGFKQQNDEIIIGPGQWPSVDTGGVPISEAFMQLPYAEPSLTLKELWLQTNESMREQSSASDMGILDSKEDIPTGTVIAALERKNVIQSSSLRSFHGSLSHELQLIDQIFRTIAQDYIREEIKIIPVSDPSVNSSLQRVMKAEAILRTSSQAPELHDMHAIFKMVYKAYGLDEKQIDEILPKQEMQPQGEEQAGIDPNALIMADIQQKAAEVEAKERIATERAETDVFKAQLDFEKEKAKIESNEDIAQLKSETELTKQGVSQNEY
jgi:hypothetical protein